MSASDAQQATDMDADTTQAHADVPATTREWTIADLVPDQGLPLEPSEGDDDEPLYCLAYMSTSAALLGLENDQTLVRLLTACRRANISRRITGLLLYIFTGTSGHFIQVLEGREDHVRQTFSRIVLDRRHKDIITLWEGRVAKRQFGSWLMSFKPMNVEAMQNCQLEGVAKNGFQSFAELRHSLLLSMEGSGTSDPIQIVRKLAASLQPELG